MFRLLPLDTRNRCRVSAGGSILSGFCGKLVLGANLKQLTPKQLGDEDNIDEDVRAEADRVAVGGADADFVKVGRLRARIDSRQVLCLAVHNAVAISHGAFFSSVGSSLFFVARFFLME